MRRLIMLRLSNTLEPVEKIDGPVLTAIAVYIGKTRLIDNFIVE